MRINGEMEDLEIIELSEKESGNQIIVLVHLEDTVDGNETRFTKLYTIYTYS
jgi:hypothetical protein